MKLRFALVLIALQLGAALTFAQNLPQNPVAINPEPTTVEEQREGIARERAAVQARFAGDEKACYARFAVNDCLRQADLRKREALADLRRQEVSINNTERKRKGAEQIQRMEDKSSADKQQERADKRAKALEDQQTREDKAVQKLEGRTQLQGETPAKLADEAARRQTSADKAASRSTKAVEAAEKRRIFDDKQKEADERRKDLAKRLAEKDKPPAAPLPPRP